jgi:Na+/H+-dicarboxylate symporter
MVTQLGCAELIGFTIGTASNVTGDLITKYVENEEKKDKEDDVRDEGSQP